MIIRSFMQQKLNAGSAVFTSSFIISVLLTAKIGPVLNFLNVLQNEVERGLDSLYVR